MTNPSSAGGGFGRTLQELFTATPVQGQGSAPVLAGDALIEVPDLTDMEQAEAEQLLRERRLTPRVRLLTADGDPGTVKSQAPKAGEVVAAGTQVTLYIIKARELSDLEKIRKVFDDAKILTADNFVQALDDNEDFQKFVATVKVADDDLLKKIEGLATQQDVDNALPEPTHQSRPPERYRCPGAGGHRQQAVRGTQAPDPGEQRWGRANPQHQSQTLAVALSGTAA